jgi:hypothetical protein
MKINTMRLVGTVMVVAVSIFPAYLQGGTSGAAKEGLGKLLLGKEVKTLIELPATKEGLDVYLAARGNKRLDERGVDLGALSKYLKSRGVGVGANEWETITDVRVDKDRVELHLGGGGEGRRGGKHAQKISPGYKRAGGSRVNFRFQRDLSDSDLAPQSFLRVMARILDVSEIQNEFAAKDFPEQFKQAIASKTVKEGMSYQMVGMAFGEPEQKKIDDSNAGDFSETWYYLKEGHRWVLTFSNGKLGNIKVF